MKKNIYEVAEIDTIFKNCFSHKEIFEACKVFRQLFADDLITKENFNVASQYSVLRFKELTGT